MLQHSFAKLASLPSGSVVPGCHSWGHAGGVMSLFGALPSLPTITTLPFSEYFRLGRATRVVLPSGNGGVACMFVIFGYQAALRSWRLRINCSPLCLPKPRCAVRKTRTRRLTENARRRPGLRRSTCPPCTCRPRLSGTFRDARRTCRTQCTSAKFTLCITPSVECEDSH